MNVPLTPQQEKLIKQKVKSGEYGSPDEVIDAALRLLEQRDKKLASLRQDVRAGLDQLERGEYVEYTDETLDQLFDEIESEAVREPENSPQNAE
jgi:antitoxin ParD1/3/4